MKRPVAGWRRGRALLLAILLATACATEEEELGTHLERAQSHREAGRYAEALVELRSALALDPSSAETNFQMAEVLLAQRQPGNAIFHFQESRRLDPLRVEAYLAEAALVRRVDPELAQTLVEEAIEVNPSHVESYLLLTEVALERSDPEAALAAAERAVELAPDRAASHFQLGRVHRARLRGRESDAGELDPAISEQALQAFERAAALDDEERRWRSLVQRARVLAAWPERSGEAADAYRAAVEAAAQGGTAAHVVRAAGVALDFAHASEDVGLRRWLLERILEADDSQLAAWRELARMEAEADRSAEAIYQRLLDARSDDALAHVAYARFLLGEARTDEALAHLEKTADAGIDPPLVLGTLAEIQYDLGRSEEAGRTVERLEASFPDAPTTQLARAERALAERRVADAAELLVAILDGQESAPAQRLLALARFRLGDLEAAAEAVDRAVELAPRQARPRALRARIRHASRDWEGALQDLRWIAARARPLSAAERLIVARCFYATAGGERGRRTLERLIEETAPYVPAVLEYARRERRDNPERVRASLERAEQVAPDHPELLAMLAELDLEAGNPERALERLDRAAAVGPASPAVLLTRARLLIALGRLAEAGPDARRAFEAAPGRADAADLMVRIYGSQGQVEEAVSALEEAQSLGQLQPPAQVLLARLYRQTDREAEARALFEEALATEAELPLAKNDLAYLLAREGVELDRARELANQALQAQPNHPAVLHTLGYVLLRKGLDELGVLRLEQAVAAARAQGDPPALYEYHLGLGLRRIGRNSSAAEAFARALLLDPDFPEAERARREREAALAGRPPSSDLL